MPLSDIVDVQITTLTGGVAQAGFGVPFILGYKALFIERIRFYTDPDGVATDFATTTPEYRAAAVAFSQNPRPERIAIGRGLLPPTQRFDYYVVNVVNSQKYSIMVGATQVDFTSDASATNDEIIAGLQAAAAAVATALGFTASVQGVVGSTFLRILGNAAGNWMDTEVLDLNYLKVEQNHADPGVATDLAQIKLIDNSWYGLLTLYNSKAYVSAAAGWTEANEKLYIAASLDSEIATVAEGSATDIAKTLKTSAYFRTALFYHQNNGKFADAAWAGLVLPFDPGSETWKFKTLAGVPATVLTTTWQTNITNKLCNFYYTIAGRNITAEGKVSSGEFIDVIRFRDWLKARLQERIFLMLANARKVPYTDAGIALVEAEVRAQLREGVDVGGLVDGFTVIVPKAATVNPADKAARILRNVKFNAQLAGAIHAVKINGVISL